MVRELELRAWDVLTGAGGVTGLAHLVTGELLGAAIGLGVAVLAQLLRASVDP